MRSLRLKRNLPKDCYAIILDCDFCGVECTTEPIYDVEIDVDPVQWFMCITCIHKRWPDWVEVVE
jgi:hypothetical protein